MKLTVLIDQRRPPEFERIESACDVKYVTADALGEGLAGADALLMWDFFSTALADNWRHADSLKWIHVAAAGVDSLLFPQLRESAVTVTNARGIFDRPIAEFVLGQMLAFAKDSATSMRHQTNRRWEHRETLQLAGSRALILGTGAIGRETARLLRAVGVRLTGAGSYARAGDPDFGDVIDSAKAASALTEAAGRGEPFDWLINIAPRTPATEGLIDAAVLQALGPDARLINVGRGATVNQDDLIDALQTRAIAGAALDVFAEEPLPPTSPLWELENVLISPHMSGDALGWRERLSAQFRDNFDRFLAGDQLLNQVDLRLGYVPASALRND